MNMNDRTIKGGSQELAKISLIAFINYSQIFALCRSHMNKSFYENQIYKDIYSAIDSHYKQYNTIPSRVELKTKISQMLSNSNVSEQTKEDYFLTISDLYLDSLSSEDSARDKTIEFIRRRKIESGLSSLIDIAQDSSLDLDKALVKVQEVSMLDISKKESFNLADIDKLEEMRINALGDITNSKIVKFFIPELNYIFQYKGFSFGTLNMISAAPGVGKSTLLMNQALKSAMDGLNVCYVSLGDMTEYDFILRLYSTYTIKKAKEPEVESNKLKYQIDQLDIQIKEKELRGLDASQDKARRDDLSERLSNIISSDSRIYYTSSKIAEMSVDEQRTLIRNLNLTANGTFKRIDIMSYAADEITVSQLVEEVELNQRKKNIHYDVIIVDYDENIKKEDKSSDNVYEEGGGNYNRLAYLAGTNKSCVFVACQPKPTYWGEELLPLESAAESSKKQKIIDTMITIGRPKGCNSIRSLFVPKNRRGEAGKFMRLKFDGETGFMYRITDLEYQQIKQAEKGEVSKESIDEIEGV